MIVLYLICLVILGIFLYALLAGAVGSWLHHYLVGTSKNGDYNHDHRMCIFGSVVWFIPIIYLFAVFCGRVVTKVYSYPGKVYSSILSRRKLLESEKK